MFNKVFLTRWGYVNSELPNSWDNKISHYYVRVRTYFQAKIVIITISINLLVQAHFVKIMQISFEIQQMRLFRETPLSH